jgi:hypothetical protein
MRQLAVQEIIMKPVFVVDNGEPKPMQSIRCTDEDEQLQKLLEKNPDLLAGEQIDPEQPRRWLLVKREMPIPDPASGGGGRWAVDFLFVDQDAIPTFVECKRFNDTRSRREVVGQVMEYAANGQFYWNHETLKGFARSATRPHNESLEDALKQLLQAEQLNVEDFFKKAEANLKDGTIRIVFFMEEAPVELKCIVEFLNDQLEHTDIFIVEAHQYTKGELRLVVPSLFGYSEKARRVKTSTSTGTSAQRRSWNRPSVLAHFSSPASKELLARFAEILKFVDEHADRLREGYGTGQSPTLVIRNLDGDAMLYIYGSGDVQLPIPYIIKSMDFASLESLAKKYAPLLSWKASFEVGKYVTLSKKIQAANLEEQNALKQFLLDIASAQRG